MLFDAKRRRLVERRIFQLEHLPAAKRTWYELNGAMILYLGVPAGLTVEMWADDSEWLRPDVPEDRATPAEVISPDGQR
jgi:hypothetical protein